MDKRLLIEWINGLPDKEPESVNARIECRLDKPRAKTSILEAFGLDRQTVQAFINMLATVCNGNRLCMIKMILADEAIEDCHKLALLTVLP